MSTLRQPIRLLPTLFHRRLLARSSDNSVSLLHLQRRQRLNIQYYSTVIDSRCPDIDTESVANTSISHYVINQFRKYYDQTALIDGLTGRTVTYGQLETLIARVASSLVKNQLATKSSRVIICSVNSIEYVVMYYALLSVGAVISTVNPAYTIHELVYSVNLVEATLIVTDESLQTTAHQARKQCPSVKKLIVLGDVADDVNDCRPYSSLLTDEMSLFDNSDVNGRQDVALLPFSSGTTGLPKAVMLTHHNIISNILQMGSPFMLNFTPGNESVSTVMPFYHIYGQVVMMLHGLAKGAKLILLPKFEPNSYLRSIEKYRATYLFMAPPMLLFLSQYPLVADTDFSSVHSLLSGAAPVSTSTIEKALDRCRNSNMEVRQGYGLTETSPLTHCNPPTRAKIHTVGLVTPNTQYKIVDVETGKSLTTGQTGEICIRGPQVMKGYYKNPQATADCLRDGWFYTGDSGHYDEDHYLVIEDRIKELIKVKGLQVAPAELEGVLVSHSAVQDAAVIGRPNERFGEMPTAFVVVKPNHAVTEAELQAFVAGRLAQHKQLTGGVVFCNEIPKAPSGKILRRLLRDQLKK